MTATSRVRIVNKLGLHARAAARFVDLASDYRARVEIRRGDDLVDGKSILGILTLAAPRGTELELVAEGDDADEALSALSRLIETGFGEEA